LGSNYPAGETDKITGEQEEKQVSFDDYIETYKKEIQESINFIGQDVDFFIELKADLLTGLAEKNLKDTNNIKMLDIGSGVGLVDRYLKKRFRNLQGVDVEAGVVEKAKNNNPEIVYSLYDGVRLPFEDNTFDMTFAVNVVHHVPPQNWQNFVNEMHRVLKPGGIAAVFEHNPVNPLTRIAVARCEFDRDAVLLNHSEIISLFNSSGFEITEDKYIVFFPFKAKLFRGLEKMLSWFPLGAQHYAAGRKKC
jgi:SAM-dependent methyltransferase